MASGGTPCHVLAVTKDVSGDRWDAAQEGAELLREGEIDRAVDELERVVREDPNNEYGFFFLGSAHFEKQRFEKAMKAYLRALEIAPDYLGALVHLGQTLRMLGKYGEAMRVAREALERSGDDPDALYLLGMVHYARGEKAAAIKYLELFLKARPELEAANEAEGLIRMLRGQIDETKPDHELN